MANSDLSVGKYMSEGWELFKGNAVNFAAAALVVLLVNVVASAIPFAGLLVAGPLLGGLSLMALDAVKGEKPGVGRMGGVSDFLAPTVIIGILTGVFGFVGSMLLILPGILVFGWYMFSYMIALDTGVGGWAAMERSRAYGFSNHLGVFIFALAILVVNLIGALLFGIGLLVTLPMTTLAVAAAYRDILQGEGTARIEASTPPPPPPATSEE